MQRTPLNIPFIDLKAQYRDIQESVHQNIQTVLDHGQYIMGPEVIELEENLANYVGVKHCIAASSGTDTLLIAMMALNINPGDEIITTPFSFISTAEMILLLGAKPVFVDIDSRTYNISADSIADAITSKTKAIMPVSLYGQCADMDAINQIAQKHKLPVIEDAAQSFGSTYKGKKSCGLSLMGSTSFFPSKPLGCYGDGGALFTNDDDLARTMREIRVHGQTRRYHHAKIGINGRMDTLQAAILLAKLPRFEWEIQQRREIAQRYDEIFYSIKGDVVSPYIASCNQSVYAQYTIQVEEREKFCAAMKAKNIPTAIHYPTPLHKQPAIVRDNDSQKELPVVEKVAQHVVSLPMGPDLSIMHQNYITDSIYAYFTKS